MTCKFLIQPQKIIIVDEINVIQKRCGATTWQVEAKSTVLQINSFPMYLSSTVRSWEHLISGYQYFIQAVRSTATQFQLITTASSGCWGRRKHEWRRCVGSVSGTDPPGGSRGWVLVTAIVPTGTVVPPTLLPWLSTGVGVLWQRGLLLLASVGGASCLGSPYSPWAATWCGAATTALTSSSLPVVHKKKTKQNQKQAQQAAFQMVLLLQCVAFPHS